MTMHCKCFYMHWNHFFPTCVFAVNTATEKTFFTLLSILFSVTKVCQNNFLYFLLQYCPPYRKKTKTKAGKKTEKREKRKRKLLTGICSAQWAWAMQLFASTVTKPSTLKTLSVVRVRDCSSKCCCCRFLFPSVCFQSQYKCFNASNMH